MQSKKTCVALGCAVAFVTSASVALAETGVVLSKLPTVNSNVVGSLEYAGITTRNVGTFDIAINAGSGLAANGPALAAFNRAAAQWEQYFSDPVTININSNLGTLPAGVIGSTGNVTLQAGYDFIRNQMVADAADEADDTIVAGLPTAATFSALLPAGRSLNGNLTASKANLKALGFTGLDSSFGPNDANITFSNTFAFDYDNSDGVGAGLLDFETVAAHEIGHALGFVSIVDDIDGGETIVQPNTLDLFRFRNDLAGADPSTASEFATFPRSLVPGANEITDEIANEWRMSTGVSNGDGRQASHWKADELTGVLIGQLDPTLASEQFYDAMFPDVRAMDLIGYDVIPEPSSLALLSLGALFAFRRRRA